jgi:hypothetical protein
MKVYGDSHGLHGMQCYGNDNYGALPLFSGTDIAADYWVTASDLSTLYQATAQTTPVTADGQDVKCITNKGALGGYFDVVSATTEGVYKTGVLNGKPAVRADSATGFMLGGVVGSSFTSFSFLYAGKISGTGSIISGTGAGGGLQVRNVIPEVLRNSVAVVGDAGTSYSTTNAFILGITYNVVTGDLLFYRNGALVNTVAAGSGITWTGVDYLMCTVSATECLAADFGEMALLKSAVLSPTQMAAQMRLLNNYWLTF